MNTKEMINKVKEWNVNLKKHSPNIPYTQTDEDAIAAIIKTLKEYNVYKEVAVKIAVFLDEVNDRRKDTPTD